MILSNFALKIAAKPTFLPGGELQNLEVVQGQDAKFTCLSTGIPAPNVTWSINGVDLDSREYLIPKSNYSNITLAS